MINIAAGKEQLIIMAAKNPMKYYTHLLFDLDGTITDSEEGILNSIRHCLTHYRIDHPEPSILKKFIGPPLIQSLKEHYAFDPVMAEKAVKVYREYFRKKGIYENKLYPGIPGLLKSLHERGRIIMLATAKPTFYAKKIVIHFKIGPFLADVVGSNMDGSRMDKKEIIQHILDRHPEVPVENFIMIGDRMHDIMGARHHGMDSIWVKYGYGDEDDIKSLAPTYMADSVSDLRRLLLPD
ncbi:MAG: HAD hydrolase-like protein [Cyclobacteriaceae bacterium]|nr:HAD hydrolase-like protein [Cyclobacteriaceae bacterium]